MAQYQMKRCPLIFLSLDERNCTINSQIKISKRGRIIDPPQDLFDQFEIDLDRMLGI
ncbi:DUF3696 domain-containing protein [Clostridium botulinum]|nr:DUF3696 domain-containing protein [Clostridium botulinum]MBO0565474.1 DUF3696 domain-containing protein [Clostridium botulinum]